MLWRLTLAIRWKALRLEAGEGLDPLGGSSCPSGGSAGWISGEVLGSGCDNHKEKRKKKMIKKIIAESIW